VSCAGFEVLLHVPGLSGCLTRAATDTSHHWLHVDTAKRCSSQTRCSTPARERQRSGWRSAVDVTVLGMRAGGHGRVLSPQWHLEQARPHTTRHDASHDGPKQPAAWHRTQATSEARAAASYTIGEARLWVTVESRRPAGRGRRHTCSAQLCPTLLYSCTARVKSAGCFVLKGVLYSSLVREKHRTRVKARQETGQAKQALKYTKRPSAL